MSSSSKDALCRADSGNNFEKIVVGVCVMEKKVSFLVYASVIYQFIFQIT
jgi:hypothetical protein